MNCFLMIFAFALPIFAESTNVNFQSYLASTCILADETIYAADPKNCSRYYECSQGILSLRDCPGSMYWNSKENYCDDRENVDCPTTPPTTTEPTTYIPTTRQPSTVIPMTTTPRPTTKPTTHIPTTTTTPRPTTKPTTTTTTPRPTTKPTTHIPTTTTTPRPTTKPTTHIPTTTTTPRPTTKPTTHIPTTTTTPRTTPTTHTPTTTSTPCPTTKPTTHIPTTTTTPRPTTPTTHTPTTTTTPRPTTKPTTHIPTTTTTPRPTTKPTTHIPTTTTTPRPTTKPTTHITTTTTTPRPTTKPTTHIPTTTTTPRPTTKPSTHIPTTTTTSRPTTKPTTHIPTTTRPIPEDCPATGSIEIAYPGDCSKYYQCNDGTKTLMDCPENLHFNREIGSCDYIDSANCENPSTVNPTTTTTTTATPSTPAPTTKNPIPYDDCPTTGSVEIAYPYDCSKYYQCTDGDKELRNCPEGLQFNMEIGSCDYIDNANCGEPSTVSPRSTQPTTAKPTMTTPIPTTRMPIPDDCPATGSIQIAYPDDCSKYYQCNDGNKILTNCPENLHFNREIGSCDYIDSANCEKSSTVDPTTTAQPITINPTITTQVPTTTTIKTTTPEPVTTTQIPTTQKPMPSDKCPTKGFAEIAYPYDCTKYYMCTDGNKELKNCPEGLHFDGATGSCDYIDIANCRQPSTVSPSTTSQATTTKPTVTTQKPTTKMPIPDHCPATGSIQIAYPEDCSKYFQCTDGKKTLMDCPENMNFNKEIGSCDYSDSFDCEPATTWSPTGWTPDPMCPYPAERVTFYPDPSNCSLYFECVDGNKEVKECPDGLYWSQRMLACDFPQYVDCSITTLTDAKPTMTSQIFSTKIPSRDGDCPASGSIQIAYPDDCNKYYQCEIGHKELKNCPESLHFNGETRSCDYRDIVNCSQTRLGILRNTQIEGPIVFLESEVAQLVHSEEKT